MLGAIAAEKDLPFCVQPVHLAAACPYIGTGKFTL